MDLSKYAALFLAESREHLSSCNQLLLKWEREPAATDPVGGLFRSIHTIKGMGATMGFTGVAELAHRLESLLDALRHGRVTPEAGTFELLFRAVDTLGAAVESAAAGRQVAPDAALVAALDRATAPGRGAAPVAEAVAPAVPTEPHRRRATDARGRSVQVVIRADAVMRGARAVLAVRRVEALGLVTTVRPPLVQLEREEFDGKLSFRIESPASEDELAAVIRTAGEVESVRFEEPTVDGTGLGRQRQIRVDLDRLDRLMKQVGELVVAKNRLGVMAAHGDDAALVELADRISRLVSGLQAEVIASRMTPVGEVFERFPRLVRDLARDLGKRIRFDLEGEEIELDRSILDEIGDPLLHLIRNAADHGIEPPEVRAAAGKPVEGRILLAAARERNSVVLRVTDDGRGIDRAAILSKARREDAIAGAEGEALTDDALLRVIARPGFSTARQVSGVSGRGVGVDVAMTRVRQLGGTLEIRSEVGKGTTFQIRVPLTLAIVRALLADAGGERYAVPLAYVAETVDFDPRAVTALRTREALVVREQVIPTVHLRDLVASRERPAPRRRPTVILEVGERRTALVVDALLGQQDIVVAPFDAPRGMPPFVGGATILADGAPALVLDAAALL
ncbi:MAG TPA: chemotaxis protein CheA [Gemmatimonadales bacterium]|jgi:two-component system chemotaxis sensor kinase CheA|nr:chemotaxis protein CheA [Gemmatimonadales bacterium]